MLLVPALVEDVADCVSIKRGVVGVVDLVIFPASIAFAWEMWLMSVARVYDEQGSKMLALFFCSTRERLGYSSTPQYEFLFRLKDLLHYPCTYLTVRKQFDQDIAFRQSEETLGKASAMQYPDAMA